MILSFFLLLLTVVVCDVDDIGWPEILILRQRCRSVSNCASKTLLVSPSKSMLVSSYTVLHTGEYTYAGVVTTGLSMLCLIFPKLSFFFGEVEKTEASERVRE